MRKIVLALVPLLVFACDQGPSGPEASAGALPDPALAFGAPDALDVDGLGGSVSYRFVGNGKAGYVTWDTQDADGVRYIGYLQVIRGGSTKDPQTFLYYSVARCTDEYCYSPEYLAGGDGLIPNPDVSGSPNQLRLNTNTTDNPNFNVWAGARGEVSAAWQASGIAQSSFSGVGTIENPWFSHRQQGQWTSAFADATANIGGYVIPSGAFGQIQTNHTVTIEWSR